MAAHYLSRGIASSAHINLVLLLGNVAMGSYLGLVREVEGE